MKELPESTIVAAFTWPHSVQELALGFTIMGLRTTARDIEETWQRATERGDLPPIERPASGFQAPARQLLEAMRLT